MEEEEENTVQPEIRDQLLNAHQGGNLMEAIERLCRSPDVEEEDVANALTRLHNGGSIDVVEQFFALTKSRSGFIYFEVLHVFERTLPHIKHGVSSVIQCVDHLIEESGEDLAAGAIVDYLIEFIAKDATRAKEALASAKADPRHWSLLSAVLVAGCRLDMKAYLEETLLLLSAEDPDTRQQAVFALSRIGWPEGGGAPESVYEALERARDSETDDALLAAIAKSAASLLKLDASNEGRLIDLIDTAIGKGGDHAIHAAASLLAWADKDMPEALTDKLPLHMKRVKAEHTGTIGQIDRAAHRLIRFGKPDIAIRMAEELIAEKDLNPDVFDTTLHNIQRDPALLNKAVTRWLLNGDAALCRNAAFLVGGGHGANLAAEVDPAEINAANAAEMTLLARKICGHLFMNPVSAASMLLSLLRLAQDDWTRTKIGKLLLNPLLINYPGKARTFIDEKKDSCTPEVQEVIRQIDVALEEYFDALRAIDEIPELYPSLAHREAYQRHHTREMEESFSSDGTGKLSSPSLIQVCSCCRATISSRRKILRNASLC